MKRHSVTQQIFEIEGRLFTIENFNHNFSPGMKLYDSRKGEFVELETEEDCVKYSCVAPELLGLLVPYQSKLD